MTVFLYGALEARRCEWSPSVDIYRSPKGWVLKFDLAGVRSRDVRLEVSESTIRVSGTRRDWITEEGWSHYSMEISYCQFQRSVKLPASLAKAEISTEWIEGMLIVRIQPGERER